MQAFGKGIVAMFAIIGVLATIQQLRGQGGTPLEGANVAHVGIMVKDMDATIKAYQDILGVTMPPAKTVGPLSFPTEVPNAAASRVKFTQGKVGNLMIELIEPVAGPGPHRDHIDKFGQGLQHIALQVKDPPAVTKFLQSKGGTVPMNGYVDLKDILGFTIEVQRMPAQPAQ